MAYIIYIIIFFIHALSSTSLLLQMKNKYLSSTQWKTINSLIKNPTLTPLLRTHINGVIYNSYEKYALNCANEFRRKHYYTSKNINLDELKLYSKVGLYRAINNYNYKYNGSFINYATIYINGELYRGLTELYPLSSIPKSKRRNLQTCKDTNNKLVRLFTKFVSYENNWIFDKYYEKQYYTQYENNNIQKIIYMEYNNHLFQFINNNFDAFAKRVFYYKYDIDFNAIRSNKDISYLMDCSEEKIRQSIIHIKSIIRDFF